jgi:uncharacterized protein YndB with AHSA1/START domain
MTRLERLMDATPDHVWSILCDGWLYPLWVVGASRMREVDDGWPAVGTRLHHSVGSWPLLIDDTTSVLECDPGKKLVLKARAYPAGDAKVVLQLEASGAKTLVSIDEDAMSGPGRLVPKPARALGLVWRNTEALRRLAYLTERRA